jgi:hypothetical protein
VGVRLLAIGGPIALGTAAARLTVELFDAGTSPWVVAVTALGVATVVSLVAARAAMRLLPLAVLLKMTMVFPDRAPSRIKVARRATSSAELRERLADPNADARETATSLLALVTALGRHDRKTRGHSERVRMFCDLIGTELGLSEADRGRLRWVGLVHDIGKLEVAASVLNKPSKLDEDEWELIRQHPHTGARLAQPLAQWLGPWYDGIGHHHERYDGTGYPYGLAGEQISFAGRAVSVVDAFETMTAARSYKSPMTTAAARAELTRCAGSHFDPVMVRAFLAIALPRLLWTMGPLTFLVNVPFLRWMPAATERAATLANASVGAASNAVGVTAVSVAIAAAPTQSLAQSHAHHHVTTEAAGVVRLAAQGADQSRPATAGQPAPTPRTAGVGDDVGSQGRPVDRLAPAVVRQAADVDGPAATQPVTGTSSAPTPRKTSTDSGALADAGGSAPATTPPGRSKTPPGQAKTPPGQAKTPPGRAKTPPGQAKTSSPTSTRTPPVASSDGDLHADGAATAQAAETPPGQAATPPGQAGAPPAHRH